jgi:molybdopterin/thiamine biosynthesis adenylyltransferase
VVDDDALAVDGDVVERSNISRIVGATVADVGAAKVETASRYARGLGVDVRTIPRALLRAEDAAALSGAHSTCRSRRGLR